MYVDGVPQPWLITYGGVRAVVSLVLQQETMDTALVSFRSCCAVIYEETCRCVIPCPSAVCAPPPLPLLLLSRPFLFLLRWRSNLKVGDLIDARRDYMQYDPQPRNIQSEHGFKPCCDIIFDVALATEHGLCYNFLGVHPNVSLTMSLGCLIFGGLRRTKFVLLLPV